MNVYERFPLVSFYERFPLVSFWRVRIFPSALEDYLSLGSAVFPQGSFSFIIVPIYRFYNFIQFTSFAFTVNGFWKANL